VSEGGYGGCDGGFETVEHVDSMAGGTRCISWEGIAILYQSI